jgi:hypothetical protein
MSDYKMNCYSEADSLCSYSYPSDTHSETNDNKVPHRFHTDYSNHEPEHELLPT